MIQNRFPGIIPFYFKKVKRVFYFTCIFIIGLLQPAEAQKPGQLNELLQEFFIGQTVYAQSRNEVQFTIKPFYTRKDEVQIIHIPLQLEYGLTNRFQIELELPYGFKRSLPGQNFNGTGNAEVGVLYNVLAGHKPFALSLALNVGLPTARNEKETDDTEIEWEPSLIIAKQVGRMQVHASLAAEITKDQPEFDYSLATVYPFANWRATLELNAMINGEKIMYVTPGLIWKGLDDFEFGIGLSKSVTKNYSECTYFLMITHEFTLKGKH